MPSARGEKRRGDFLQIHHGDEFVGDQLVAIYYCPPAALRLAGTPSPATRVEDTAEGSLEGDAVAEPAGHGGEQGVQGRDQCDEADQHRRHDNRDFKARQNVLPSISKKSGLRADSTSGRFSSLSSTRGTG